MGLPTGLQDHYPALLGGALEIRPVPGASGSGGWRSTWRRWRRACWWSTRGRATSRPATTGRWCAAAWRRSRRSPACFEGIAATAAELAPALEAGDLPRVGELMSREWSYRRRLAEGISTPVLEELLRAAAAAGAWGGKACGAGGGGCLAILGPPERRRRPSRRRLEGAGGKILQARPDRAGAGNLARLNKKGAP